MHQIKLLVTDMDGTLLRDDKTISQRTKDALAKLQENGVIIVFASGRTNFMMKLYQEPYVACDYHISFNGAMIGNLKLQEDLQPVIIDQDIQEAVWNYLAEEASAYTAYTKDKMYYFEKNTNIVSRKIDDYVNLASQQGIKIDPDATILAEKQIDKDTDCHIIKFVAYEDDQQWLEEFLHFINQLHYVKSEATGYGVTGVFNEMVSKKDALVNLCRKLNISQEEVCAIGDYDNDLSMFEVAGLKVAMENASQSLKDKADIICPSNNDDGVGIFIEENLL